MSSMLDETDKVLKRTALYTFARLRNATSQENEDEIF